MWCKATSAYWVTAISRKRGGDGVHQKWAFVDIGYRGVENTDKIVESFYECLVTPCSFSRVDCVTQWLFSYAGIHCMGVRMMLVVHTVIQYYRLQTLNECSNNWSSGQSYIVVILSTTVPQMEKNSVLNMIIFVLNNCYPTNTSVV